MFSKAWIPVRLTETKELGYVAIVMEEDVRSDKWFFIPNGKTFAEAYIVHTGDFRVIRSMQPEPKEYLRQMSLPYKMVFDSCFIKPVGIPDDGTQIGERADAAINLLVRYTEELEKRIEELEDARISDEL